MLSGRVKQARESTAAPRRPTDSHLHAGAPDHLKAQLRTLRLLNARRTGKSEAQPTFESEGRFTTAFQTRCRDKLNAYS